MTAIENTSSYWEKKNNSVHYQVLKNIVQGLGRNLKTVIDIGSAGRNQLDWIDGAEDRVSVDKNAPYEQAGIKALEVDFFAWKRDKRYHMAMCFNGLEFSRKPELFAEKLLATANIVIIMVPYKWAGSASRSHINKTIDEAKLVTWFKREPNFSYVCHEVHESASWLVQVYERNEDKWSNLTERAKQRRAARSNTQTQVA